MVIELLAGTMRLERDRIAAGEMRGERLRLRVSRVEHVERVEVFNAEAQRRRVRRGG